MVRWKPLLGKGKKEIACESASEGEKGGWVWGRRKVEAESPTSAHPPIYGSRFQQGHSRWGGLVDMVFSRVNSSEPLVWSVWGLICSEDPLTCLSACVSSIDPHCVSSGSSLTFPQRPVSEQCSQSSAPVSTLSS